MSNDPPPPCDSAKDFVDRIIKALVEHYRDPIHEDDVLFNHPKETTVSDIDEPVEGTSSVAAHDLPPVLAFQLQQLLGYCSAESEGNRRGADDGVVVEVWVRLIESYSTLVRPAALPLLDLPQGGPATWARASSTVAVLVHYESLVSHFLRHQADVLLAVPSASDDVDNSTDRRVQPDKETTLSCIQLKAHTVALERLACDITLATVANLGGGSSAASSDNKNGDNEVEEAHVESNDDGRRLATAHALVAALVRQMNSVRRCLHCWYRDMSATVSLPRTGSSFDDTDASRVELRASISLLAFGWNPDLLLEICVTDEGELEGSDPFTYLRVPPSPLHSLPLLLAQDEKLQMVPPLSVTGMDWTMLLKLKGSWPVMTTADTAVQSSGSGANLCTAALNSAVQKFWCAQSVGHIPPPEDSWENGFGATHVVKSERVRADTQLRDTLFGRWNSETQAKAVRAHFFGRDMLPPPTAPEINQILSSRESATRLFLGKVVPYQPDPDVTSKAYVQIPSRVLVALRWFSLLRREHLTRGVWEELLPVLYELLSAAPYALNGWGAVVVHRLVSLRDVADEGSVDLMSWNPTGITNLLTMLHTVAKTCRDGPVLAVIGKVYCRLLRLLGHYQSQDASRQRRLASHHWLTVLNRNQTRTSFEPALVLGLLIGIVQLLHDQVDCVGANYADGLEVGRLGLSALLPLLANDGDNDFWLDPDRCISPSAHRRLKEDIHLATLVALKNLMVAAYPIVPRHAGKVLTHLLVVCARQHAELVKRGDDEIPTLPVAQSLSQSQRLWLVARHVAATAVVLCGDKGEAFFLSLQSGKETYKDDFWNVVRAVRQSAHELQPHSTPISATGVS
jgi:hypothetical protein